MQAQLKELGVEPRAASSYNGYPTPSIPWSSSSLGSDGQAWGDSSQRRVSSSTAPLPGYAPASGVDTAEYRPLPNYKTGAFGDNYLGVSSADSLLSHINGTSLSVFGAEIDITNFVQSEGDYDRSVMSYSHFVNVSLRSDVNIEYLQFPDYHELSQYAHWYLQSLNPYTMLVDKRAFMDLVRPRPLCMTPN